MSINTNYVNKYVPKMYELPTDVHLYNYYVWNN